MSSVLFQAITHHGGRKNGTCLLHLRSNEPLVTHGFSFPARKTLYEKRWQKRVVNKEKSEVMNIQERNRKNVPVSLIYLKTKHASLRTAMGPGIWLEVDPKWWFWGFSVFHQQLGKLELEGSEKIFRILLCCLVGLQVNHHFVMLVGGFCSSSKRYRPALLSMKYCLFNRDPYFMVKS